MLLDKSLFSLLPWNSEYSSKARYKALHAKISPQHPPVERKKILSSLKISKLKLISYAH